MDRPPPTGSKTFLCCPSSLDGTPDITVAGIPFDLGVTFRKGTAKGPAAIRDASVMLLDGDHPTFRLRPQTAFKMIDAGDFDVAETIEESLTLIEDQAARMEGHPVCLGGDHTVTLAVLRAMAAKQGKGISLVHFDAHVDTWPDSYGKPIGHGTPFHYASEEGLIDPKRSIQIGIRSPVDNAVMDHTKNDLGFTIVTADEVHTEGPGAIIEKIQRVVGDNKAYLTFDIDAIDPSQAPGTGTPEVAGLFTWQALAIVRGLGKIDWRGMDLVEIAPDYDHAQITALAGATLVWTYLSMLAARKQA